MRALVFLLLIAACGDAAEEAEQTEAEESALIELRGELNDGYLLTYFDADGPHTVESRQDVPEASRGRVRVVPMDGEGESGRIIIADLSTAGSDGTYAVELMDRAAFDALLDEAQGVAFAEGQFAPSEQVVIYGTDWCRACESAANFLRSRNVEFVERNIEQDDGARAEMMRRAEEEGIRVGGVPVIDFRGTLMNGFDPARIEALMRG